MMLMTAQKTGKKVAMTSNSLQLRNSHSRGQRQFKALILCCVIFALCLSMGFGLVLPSAAQASQDIAPFSFLQYKQFRVPDGYTGAVMGILYPDVELPATVQIAVPEGVDVYWFGEVPEGGVNPESVPFPGALEPRTADGMDIYTAVVQNSHTVQIEFYLEGFPVRSLPNGNHSIQIEYTPLDDVGVMRLAAFIPAGSVVQSPGAEYMATSPTGDIAYAYSFIDIEAGQRLSFDIEYIPPEVTARENADGVAGGIMVVAGALLLTAIIAIVMVLFMKARKK